VAIDLAFREAAVATLTPQIGVYVLCDLDQVPIYVGKSDDGIRARVRRHLTSARSDIIANRQIDVWEIAWVWTYPTETRAQSILFEAALFHHFDPQSALMNGKSLPRLEQEIAIPEPTQKVQVMSDAEISEKRDPALRLPRQAEHYSQIVGHFLAVKNSDEIARAIQAHFVRLERYHRQLLNLATPESDSVEE
jgi:excinuclease UvrABC nuclease subunit